VNRLDPILAATRAEVARRQVAVPPAALERAVAARAEADDPVRAFHGALARPGLSVIAEHKRSSPSAGPIRADLELQDVVRAYERGGAAALSILTDAPSFGGSLDDLRAARQAARLPLLRKDFVVDPYQVYESFAAGADAILLIVAALSRSELSTLHAAATELGLAALVEVHDEAELEVDTRRTFELLPRIGGPAHPHALIVSESGFSRREQIDELAEAGVDAVLIGEALMRSGDIEGACRALTRPYD
jgi:indole-3-glycerol phosphate synthase